MKAAIYCRLSEEDRNKVRSDDDSNSIRNQKAMLSQYAAEQNWEIYGIYSDDDYTGADRQRPQFNRLLEDAKAHKFDIVLCKTQSRFTRELELVERYIHGLFPVWGIRFVSIVDNADTANRGNKKSRQINGLVNEWYLEDMSENIKSVLKNLRENGRHIGAFAPYGYRKDPEQKGHLIIDPNAAGTVRQIFDLYAAGYGKTAIARRLNDLHIPNPTQYKHHKGLNYRNTAENNTGLWKYATISDILTNEVYIGNLVQGKSGSISYKSKQVKPKPREQWIRVQGTHEPIIPKDLWDRVQIKLSGKAKPFSNGQIGLFAGKVRCGCCGYGMRSSKQGSRRYLQCHTRFVCRDACEGSFISVSKLEKAVLGQLRKLSEEYVDIALLEKNIEPNTGLKKQKEAAENALAQCSRQINHYSRGIRELYLDKGKGLLNEEEYLQLYRELTREKTMLNDQADHCRRTIQDISQQLMTSCDRKSLAASFLNMEHLSREAVELFIGKICVHKRIPGTQDTPLDIYWNF